MEGALWRSSAGPLSRPSTRRLCCSLNLCPSPRPLSLGHFHSATHRAPFFGPAARYTIYVPPLGAQAALTCPPGSPQSIGVNRTNLTNLAPGLSRSGPASQLYPPSLQARIDPWPFVCFRCHVSSLGLHSSLSASPRAYIHLLGPRFIYVLNALSCLQSPPCFVRFSPFYL